MSKRVIDPRKVKGGGEDPRKVVYRKKGDGLPRIDNLR